MKTIEQFKKELFRNNSIPQNSDNEEWFNQIIDDTIEFAQRWIPIKRELPPKCDFSDMFSIDVLVKDKDNQPVAAYYDFQFDIWVLYNHAILERFTHWRPIDLEY